jgi:hypothetical protein
MPLIKTNKYINLKLKISLVNNYLLEYFYYINFFIKFIFIFLGDDFSEMINLMENI